MVVSGDDRIDRIVDSADTVAVPAFSCRLDGFVNDTFSEYANPSVYRPASVCRAGLVSILQDTARVRGSYCLGFTMYATAGVSEVIDLWIGHRRVAVARLDEGDNRLHLFAVPRKFTFRGGEPIRLETRAGNGPCRLEHLLFLPKRPSPSPTDFRICSPQVQIERQQAGLKARITWISSRPATGDFTWAPAGGRNRRVRIDRPLANHEIALEGIEPDVRHAYHIRLRDSSRQLQAEFRGSFRASPPPSSSTGTSTRPGTFPLLYRREGEGTPACGWPASAGVPFPAGHLQSGDGIRLLAAGSPVAHQMRPLAHWPDGSVRWALLDFTAPDSQGGSMQVEYGGIVQPAPETPLQVLDGSAGVTVTTGPIRVEFPRTAVILPGIVEVRRSDGTYRRLTPKVARTAAVTLMGPGGRTYRSGRPESVSVEEAGSQRICIRVLLAHCDRGGRSLFRSVFRIHLFRGRPDIRVLHTFENDADSEFTELHSLVLRSELRVGRSPSGSMERRGADFAKGKSPLRLRQILDGQYVMHRGRRLLCRGRKASGAACLTGSAGAVQLSVRDFWQNYPKGICVDSSGFSLEVCPPLDPASYPKGGEWEDRLFFYLLDGRYKLKCGVARTCEFWLRFEAESDQRGAADFRRLVQSPPLYSVPLDYLNRTRSLHYLPTKDPSPDPAYESWVEAARKAYAGDRRESRAYGMLNYGDWFGERRYNWGNLEYDASWGFLQEYLRGGHSDFYTWAEEAAHHLVDVDTCHHTGPGTRVGMQYSHCVGHVGGYYPHGFREQAIFGGSWSPSHTWVEGLFLYYLLSGDTRVLEGAEKTCELLTGEILNHYDFGNCRTSGWHLIHLSAAYRATGRENYLNAARIVADRVLERQRSSGGWDRLMVPGHCHCLPPRHRGNAGFMVGILMTGLQRYYEAAGDSRIPAALVGAAEYCIDTMWEPAFKAFRYTSCPRSNVVVGADMRILKGIAFALGHSGRRRFEQVLKEGLESALGGSAPRAGRGVGKAICSRMRGAPQVLAATSSPIEGRPLPVDFLAEDI
ncbi:MAG: hypothetical protein CME15_05600 [Gemmatimonadetes bacterium]|nr:hypothetical protein [Gemmatimonadota bacterium]